MAMRTGPRRRMSPAPSGQQDATEWAQRSSVGAARVRMSADPGQSEERYAAVPGSHL
ncbi:MAG: hypothetical protein MZU79_08940 [Anaerotruncus sp.]|nr:hypothetical protein [Anaerotruncus sp.]